MCRLYIIMNIIVVLCNVVGWQYRGLLYRQLSIIYIFIVAALLHIIIMLLFAVLTIIYSAQKLIMM